MTRYRNENVRNAEVPNLRGSNEAGERPGSPRIRALSYSASAGDTGTVQAFWREVEGAGAPLVERPPTPSTAC